LIAFFNSNTKISIFAVHPHKVSIFFNSTNIIPKFSYCPLFLFFINKKINLGVQKWPDGQRGWPNFFNKKLGVIWEVFDTIGQIEKKLKLWGWIAKIETLVFELKNAVNFDEVNCMRKCPIISGF
jgi:hypothetical protein